MVSKRWKTIGLDLSGFVAGVAATYFFGWSTRDLLWGLWISSLVSGIFFFVFDRVQTLKGQPNVNWLLSSVGILFGLVFFTVHFGAFHYIQAELLDLFIPLIPDPDRVYIGRLTWKHVHDFSITETIATALSLYWILIGVSILHDYLSVPPELRLKNGNFRPYMFVLKMHFLMFVLAALYSLGLESFGVYVVVLLLFFAPSSLKMLFTTSASKQSVAQ